MGKDVIYNLWKLGRILDIRIEFRRTMEGMPALPYLTYTERRHAPSEEDRVTAIHDQTAISHMCLALYPAIIGVSAYSLLTYQVRVELGFVY